MSNRILSLSAAAAITIATPTLASAQTVAYSTSSPVSITSFSIVDSSNVLGWGTGDFAEPARFITNDVTLKFVNKSDQPATLVKFTLDNGQYSQNIQDKGTFSPGVQIEHSFTLRGRMGSVSDAISRVEEVDFADGSVWRIAPGDTESH
jgi:hypothetical protein